MEKCHACTEIDSDQKVKPLSLIRNQLLISELTKKRSGEHFCWAFDGLEAG